MDFEVHIYTVILHTIQAALHINYRALFGVAFGESFVTSVEELCWESSNEVKYML